MLEDLALLKQLDELAKCISLDIQTPLMDGKDCLVHQFHMMAAIDAIMKASAFDGLVKVLAKYVYDL